MLNAANVAVPVTGVTLAALKALFVIVVGINQKTFDRFDADLKWLFIHWILSERLLKLRLGSS